VWEPEEGVLDSDLLQLRAAEVRYLIKLDLIANRPKSLACSCPCLSAPALGSPRVGVEEGVLDKSCLVCPAAGGLLVWELEDSGGVDAGLIWGRSRTEFRVRTGFLSMDWFS
jgi:hypothetical protein